MVDDTVQEAQLLSALQLLERTAHRLRILSIIAGYFTVLNISLSIGLIGFAAALLRDQDPFTSTATITASMVIVFPLVFLFATLIPIINFEQVRRRGDALFEEISDELAWHVKKPEAYQVPKLSQDAPNLNIRLILRLFVRSSNLPLYPGPHGPGIYATLNIAVSVLAASVSTLVV